MFLAPPANVAYRSIYSSVCSENMDDSHIIMHCVGGKEAESEDKRVHTLIPPVVVLCIHDKVSPELLCGKRNRAGSWTTLSKNSTSIQASPPFS